MLRTVARRPQTQVRRSAQAHWRPRIQQRYRGERIRGSNRLRSMPTPQAPALLADHDPVQALHMRKQLLPPGELLPALQSELPRKQVLLRRKSRVLPQAAKIPLLPRPLPDEWAQLPALVRAPLAGPSAGISRWIRREAVSVHNQREARIAACVPARAHVAA